MNTLTRLYCHEDKTVPGMNDYLDICVFAYSTSRYIYYQCDAILSTIL